MKDKLDKFKAWWMRKFYQDRTRTIAFTIFLLLVIMIMVASWLQ